MTAERYEQITGTLTQKLRQQNDKIIRDRLDFEYLFMKAEEDKKQNGHIQEKINCRKKRRINCWKKRRLNCWKKKRRLNCWKKKR